MVDRQAIRFLRSKSDAALSACVAALDAAQGDAELALAALKADARKRGLGDDPPTLACLVAVAATDAGAAVVELAADSARVLEQDLFKSAASHAAYLAIECGDTQEDVLSASAPDGEGRFSDYLERVSSTIGHRIAMRRTRRLRSTGGVVSTYMRDESEFGTGPLGVIVAVQCAKDCDTLRVFAAQLARHIAEAAPLWISEVEIPKSVRLSKRWLLTEEVGAKGGLSAAMQHEIDQRLLTFYQEVVLLRQLFLPDAQITVLEAVKELELSIGAAVTIDGFARFQAGESLGDVASSTLAGDLEWSFGNAWAEEIPASVFDLHGVKIFETRDSGPVLRNDRDAVDLLNTAWNHGASMIIVPLSRLPDDFLPLETRVAGPILQKFATFGTTVAFMGDLSKQMASSTALRAYVVETNSRNDVWFLPDKQALAERLAQREDKS